MNTTPLLTFLTKSPSLPELAGQLIKGFERLTLAVEWRLPEFESARQAAGDAEVQMAIHRTIVGFRRWQHEAQQRITMVNHMRKRCAKLEQVLSNVVKEGFGPYQRFCSDTVGYFHTYHAFTNLKRQQAFAEMRRLMAALARLREAADNPALVETLRKIEASCGEIIEDLQQINEVHDGFAERVEEAEDAMEAAGFERDHDELAETIELSGLDAAGTLQRLQQLMREDSLLPQIEDGSLKARLRQIAQKVQHRHPHAATRIMESAHMLDRLAESCRGLHAGLDKLEEVQKKPVAQTPKSPEEVARAFTETHAHGELLSSALGKAAVVAKKQAVRMPTRSPEPTDAEGEGEDIDYQPMRMA